MTPRNKVSQKENKQSEENTESKVLDFGERANEQDKEAGLDAQELERLLNERIDELDELKEKFEELDRENEDLRA